jgi:hypothetical protein
MAHFHALFCWSDQDRNRKTEPKISTQRRKGRKENRGKERTIEETVTDTLQRQHSAPEL